MENKTDIKNIYQKLLDFRLAVGRVNKDTANAYFNNKYANIESVIETISTPLAEARLTFYQFVKDDNLVTELICVDSLEKLNSEMPLINKKGDMQGLGSAITYARRYSLVVMLGMIQADDDGNGATNNTPPAPPTISQTQVLELQNIIRDRDLQDVFNGWGFTRLEQIQVQTFATFKNRLLEN